MREDECQSRGFELAAGQHSSNKTTLPSTDKASESLAEHIMRTNLRPGVAMICTRIALRTINFYTIRLNPGQFSQSQRAQSYLLPVHGTQCCFWSARCMWGSMQPDHPDEVSEEQESYFAGVCLGRLREWVLARKGENRIMEYTAATEVSPFPPLTLGSSPLPFRFQSSPPWGHPWPTYLLHR